MPIIGSCHCGSTQFEIDFAPDVATKCTCSFCSKRGALWGYCDPSQFRLNSPTEHSIQYSATNAEHRHYHCGRCGCTTFSDNPDYSMYGTEGDGVGFDVSRRKISVNLRCLDGFDVDALPIDVIDGKNLW